MEYDRMVERLLTLYLFFSFQEASMSDKKAYLNIPGEKSRELLARRQEFVARGVASTMSVFAAKAEGAIIEDVDGNRYIDFAGGIGVMNIGHSGAEAVENAVKIARYATGNPAVITFDNGYHGRTLMTMTMTSKVKPYKHRFGPFASEVFRTPFPYPYRMSMTPQEASDYCIAELERMFVGEV